jgi:hypothetical protein
MQITLPGTNLHVDKKFGRGEYEALLHRECDKVSHDYTVQCGVAHEMQKVRDRVRLQIRAVKQEISQVGF